MIKQVDFKTTIEDAFLKYSASIAQDRAIPDCRDFLKPGLRQGLYAQFTNKLTHKDKFQKAQKSVAAAMSQSYVHGDVAMYDTFIRAARPWSYRYPVESVQGNYGNPSSPDSHAAARYVEMKAAEIANIFFDGLKKNAVSEWYPNYDDTEEIPSVFPSIGFWNIVNGCSGIAVAMATSVPQFNLKEVNNALIKIIQNKDVSFDEIYCAPDFATGGTITNAAAVKESIKRGSGESIRLRATLQYDPDQNMIRATELPYGVFTNTIIEQLSEIISENESYGISKVIDHTKKEADIRIYLSKGVNAKKMIEKLYKDTSLENWFSVNMVLLDQGRFPKIFGWRAACDAYIEHIRACKKNEIQFDLDKALARQNIVEGLIIAAASIDEVVSLIRSSQNPSEAAEKLIARFKFNDEQVKAILAMKLASLTKIDAIKLDNELEELKIKIENYRYLLENSKALDEELIKILQVVSEKFGDNRRTKVTNLHPVEEVLEPINEVNVNVMLFDNNFIRVVASDDIQDGKRGRKGTNVKPPKNANLINTLYATNLSNIIAFTNLGKMYAFSISDLDYNKDYSIYEVISIQSTEQVLLLIDGSSFSSYLNLVTLSKNGYVKKTAIKEYNTRSKKGVIAVKLDEKDYLTNVFLSSSNNDKIFVTNNKGYYNYYNLADISTTGRATRGVRAIKLNNDEYIAGGALVKESISYLGIFTITSSGQGKISPLDEFSTTSRGIKGLQVMNLKEEELAAVVAVPLNKEKMFITSNNKSILLNIKDIPVQSRVTSGAKIINTKNTNITVEI